jgi:hypothetical protein
MIGVVCIIAELVFGVPVATAVAVLLGGAFAWLWDGCPLRQRLRSDEDER